MDGRRLILAFLIIVGVIGISVAIFSVDWGGEDSALKDALKPVNIADYSSTNIQTRMTVRGPINSAQEHQDLQITVGRDGVMGELLGNYDGSVLRTEVTGGNEKAYKDFLSALHNAAFTAVKRPQPAGLQYDGACSNGKRYTFEFLGGDSSTPASAWATNCSKKEGNFAGELTVVKNLFNAQLPEDQYDALTNDTEF